MFDQSIEHTIKQQQQQQQQRKTKKKNRKKRKRNYKLFYLKKSYVIRTKVQSVWFSFYLENKTKHGHVGDLNSKVAYCTKHTYLIPTDTCIKCLFMQKSSFFPNAFLLHQKLR